MLPNKIKLSPESVRTFLELRLKRVVDIQELVLSLHFDQNPDKIGVTLTSKCYKFFDSHGIFLTYDFVCKLIKALLPSHVGVYFGGYVTDTVFERCLELLQITKGKIALDLDGDLEKEIVQTLLETFASRVNEIGCNMDQFEIVERLEFPAFDQLRVHSITNSDQVLRILRYKVKELRLVFDRFDENFSIDDSDLVNLKNKTVEKLALCFVDTDYVIVEKLVEQLRKSCLNLKHLIIEPVFCHKYEFTANQICDQVIAYIRRIEGFKARFGNGLESMRIKFSVDFNVNDRHDNTWISAISNKFKHWQFKSYGDRVNFTYYDSLKMIFDDTKCKLEMNIVVYTRDVEAEEAALNVNDYD